MLLPCGIDRLFGKGAFGKFITVAYNLSLSFIVRANQERNDFSYNELFNDKILVEQLNFRLVIENFVSLRLELKLNSNVTIETDLFIGL